MATNGAQRLQPGEFYVDLDSVRDAIRAAHLGVSGVLERLPQERGQAGA